MSSHNFEAEKAKVLRFADTLRKAQSAEHLRALLYADIGAPYHTFDLIGLTGIPDNIGHGLCCLLGETLTDEGDPHAA